MTIKILVIDDEYSSQTKNNIRKIFYEHVRKSLEEQLIRTIKLETADFVEKKMRGSSKKVVDMQRLRLKLGECSAVILDVFLGGNPFHSENHNILGMIKELDPKMPIMVVSQHYESTGYNYVELMQSGNDHDGYFEMVSLDEDKNTGKKSSIKYLRLAHSLANRIETSSFRPKNEGGVSFLVLSDIQFGGKWETNDKREETAGDPLEFENCLKDKLSMADEGFDGVLLLGDVAENGMPREYESAHRTMKSLFSHYDVDQKYCIMIPGNHDFCWSAYMSSHLHCKEDKEKKDILWNLEDEVVQEELKFLSFVPFSTFCKRLTGSGAWDPVPVANSPFLRMPDWFSDTRFLLHGIHIIGVNSATHCTPETPKLAKIPALIIKEIGDRLKKLDHDYPNLPFVNIILTHHTPSQFSNKDNPEGIFGMRDLLQALKVSKHPHLLLSGHEHSTTIKFHTLEPPFNRTCQKNILGLGTATPTKKDGRRAFSTLRIATDFAKDKPIAITLRLFPWDSGPENPRPFQELKFSHDPIKKKWEEIRA